MKQKVWYERDEENENGFLVHSEDDEKREMLVQVNDLKGVVECMSGILNNASWRIDEITFRLQEGEN